MKNQRTIRTIINFGSILGFQILTLAIGMLSTPLLLQWLGDDRYGAFRAANDWGNYLNLLELGLSGSLVSLLAKAASSDDRRNVDLTLATGIRAYFKITAIIILTGIGLGVFITQLVPVKSALVSDLQIGYWIGLIAVLMLPFSPFRLLADASQRSYFANLFLGLQSVVITSLSLFLAWAKFGITGQYLAVVFGAIVFQVIMCWDSIRRYPGFVSAWRDRKSQIPIERELWHLNRSTFILKLSGQLGLFTDNIIISYLLSPATVVPFFITQRLAAIAQAQIQGIGNASWAALADLYAKGELEKFNIRTLELTKLVALVGCALTIPIFAYDRQFVTLWVGADRFGGDTLALLASANAVLLGILSLWGWLFSGTGQQARLVRPNVIATIVNLSLSLVCTKMFGTIGPLLGTFIAFTTVFSWQLPLAMRAVFGMSLSQLFSTATRPFAVGIPYAGLVWWIANHHAPWGWLGLAVEMGLAFAVYLLLAWLLVLNKLEQITWRNRIVGLF